MSAANGPSGREREDSSTDHEPDETREDLEGESATTAVVEALVKPPSSLSPEPPPIRPRRSTVVIGLCFLAILALYLWVRPPPPERGRIVQDAETGEIVVLPPTTAPPTTVTPTTEPPPPETTATTVEPETTTTSTTTTATTTTAPTTTAPEPTSTTNASTTSEPRATASSTTSRPPTSSTTTPP
ncbi:MAG: hypothetical protein GEV08_22420 [Acidimicrobiia bacterium]|nr:hypothetical protein [Acidimicrobiia bacterium]